MKRNSILLALLAVLAVIAYVVLQKPGEQSRSSESSGYMFELDSTAIDRIAIKSPTLEVLLEKRGAEWFLQKPVSYRADQNVVASTIHQAKTLEVKSIVSSNPEKHNVFMVDSTGTLVKIFEKGVEKASFVVGKVGSGYTETYVRKASSNDVAVASGVFGYVFNRVLREWRDKNIVNVPTETIKEVKFQYGDTTFVLALKDSVWMIGKDSTNATNVQDLLRNFSIVTADDFVDSALSPQPRITAQISYAGHQIRFAFSKPLGKYYVQTSSSPQWFVMETWRANNFLKRKKDLLKSGH